MYNLKTFVILSIIMKRNRKQKHEEFKIRLTFPQTNFFDVGDAHYTGTFQQTSFEFPPWSIMIMDFTYYDVKSIGE